MRLVVLYGPPGVGKLTIGGELAALTGFRLFHNHLTVDLVTAIFPPNSGAWNALAREIRREVFSAAAQAEVDLILTRAPRAADGAEIERVTAMIAPVLAVGGEVSFVQLTCGRVEHLRRLQSDGRRGHKLTDPEILTDLYDLDATLPFAPHLQLDTTDLTPTEAAARIAKHFELPRLGERA